MKRILIVVGGLIVLLVGAALAAPFLVPVETYKAKLEAAVTGATDRSFKIAGPLRLTVLPNLGLEANDVHFGNVAHAREPEMATLKRLVVGLKLWPLLRGSIEVARFVLVEPVVHLEVDKNGRGNWIFATAAAVSSPAGKSAPQAGASAPEAKGQALLKGRQLRLGEVRLEDGKVTYRDDRTGKGYALDRLALAVHLPDMEHAFGLDGEAMWNGQLVKIAVKGEALGRILAGDGSQMSLSLDAQPITVSFEGKLARTEPLALDGLVKLGSPSVRELASWVGSPIAASGRGLGPLSIAGKLAIGSGRVSFTNAAVSLDDMKGKGDVTVVTTAARPAIEARLELDKLNLNNYLGESQQSAPPSGAPAGQPGAAAGAGGAAAPSEWSDAPIDVSGLKAVDAELAFSLGALEIEKIRIGKSRLEAKLRDGVLAANLPELNLYDGTGQGRLELDGRGAIPVAKAALNLTDVNAEALLKDATGNDRLAGKANFEFDGQASGKSQRALVSALNGKGKFNFRDGAIKGINLAAMARNVTTAFLDPKAGESRQTDFSALGGTFVVTNGVLTNQDAEMISPFLRASGAGTVEFPKRLVNYRVTPKVVASLEGQSGQIAKAGVTVPVLVTGRWDDLHYQPDLAGAAEQNAQGILKGLLPGGKSEAPSGGGSTAPDQSSPGKLLKKLFGN